MRHFAFAMLTAAPLLASAAVPGTVLAAPVQVTRFATPDTVTRLGHGAAAVVSVSGGAAADPQSLADQPWLLAVQRELAGLGLGAATPGAADVVAEVDVQRQTQERGGGNGPVSLGLGGATGGRHSSLGMGLGFNIGGGPRRVDATWLRVILRDRATGQPLWEGRAENAEKSGSAAASADVLAPRMARALFAGFPGKSGDTISVK
ncbi:DUF4136 domain-containing protein [Novosphingobium pokkalii]|uniref:DUF4136 domain-containing protein n=1 Tax=Novosphingobium pokkalii TaxID=1770194 RepID=A0ABV7V7T0_9SPHN|nr:DUF4136 domain-containing protein [Novosphingobium pokkalii]GHD01800.1 hypothetical protein GCM10019060_36500 [Novosphingobium pokkalii]